MIKIGLFGFGRTGRTVAGEIINSTDCRLEWVVRRTATSVGEPVDHFFGTDSNSAVIHQVSEIDETGSFFDQYPVDVIIDFSHSNGVRHYQTAAERGIKIVSTISKYQDEDLALLHGLSHKTAILQSPNITVGINFLMEISKLLKGIAPHADIEIVEEHFRNKAETSGTALRIADALGLDAQKHVNTIRVGGIVGRHEVIFGFPNQTVRLSHESISRKAFGQGALFAARWIINHSQGLFSMEEIIRDSMRKHLSVDMFT